MANASADLEFLIQQVANLAQEVSVLRDQLHTQEKTIARQEQTIKEQQLKIEFLETNQQTKPVITGGARQDGKNRATQKDATLLHRLPKFIILSIFLVAVGVVGLAVLTSTKDAQSKILVNPAGYTQQFGAILLPAASIVTGTILDNGVRVGVVATGNPNLDLSSLPIFDTGVYAAGSGYGVYANSNSSQGFGLYASNTATTGLGSGYAIYGSSQKGIGVGGTSFGSGYGIYGVSNSGAAVYGSGGSGSGVLASSTSGAPFTIVAGNTPTGGGRQFGDFYVDVTGKVYVWAKSNDGLTSNWRQLQFAT